MTGQCSGKASDLPPLRCHGGELGQEMWGIPQESQLKWLPGLKKNISQTCFKIFSSSQNVGDSALCTFSQTCCNIESLDLSSCKKLSDKTFHCLAQHCTKLATLNISSCSNLTDTSLRQI